MNVQPSNPKAVKLQAFSTLVRIPNLLMLALTQLLVQIFLIGKEVPWLQTVADPLIWLLIIMTASIAAAGYIINDYYDIKIDLVNKPKRVVVGRAFSRREAMVMHFTLNFIAIAIAITTDWKTTLLMLGCATGMWLYSNRLKQLPFVGNFSISFFTALAVYLPSFYHKTQQEQVLLYAIFAFAISLIREIIKDMEDVNGDEQFGCKTLPIVWGYAKTKFLLYFLFLGWAVMILSLPLWIADTLASSPWRLLGIVLFLPLAIQLYRADTQKDFHRLSIQCKLVMAVGVGSMLFI